MFLMVIYVKIGFEYSSTFYKSEQLNVRKVC